MPFLTECWMDESTTHPDQTVTKLHVENAPTTAI